MSLSLVQQVWKGWRSKILTHKSRHSLRILSQKSFLIAFPRVIADPRVIEWYNKLYKECNEEATDSDEYDQYLTDEAYGFSSSQ